MAFNGSSKKPGKFEPRRRRFDYARDAVGAAGGYAPDDDHTIKPGIGADLTRNRYKSLLTFRPFPMLCAENPAIFDPYRLSDGATGFGDWTRRVPAVREIGEPDEKLTFLLYDPSKEGIDPRRNPYTLVYDRAKGLSRRDGHPLFTDCLKLIKGENTPLKRPNTLQFFQGAIYQRGKDMFYKEPAGPRGLAAGDRLQIIQIVDSAAQSLTSLLCERKEGFDGAWTEFNKYYKYGDPVSLDYGRFIYIWHKTQVDFGNPEDETSGGGSSKGMDYSYSAFVSRYLRPKGQEIKQKISASMTGYEAKIRDVIQWWDDVLYYPPMEEIAFWTAKSLRAYSKLVRLAWGDNPEYFTAEVEGALSYRSQIAGAAIPRSRRKDESDEEEEVDLSKMKVKGEPIGGRSKALPLPFMLDEDEEVEDEVAGVDPDEEDDSDDEDEAVPFAGGKDKAKSVIVDDDDEEEEDEEEEDEEEEEEEEDEVVDKKKSSVDDDDEDEDDGDNDEDEDDEDETAGSVIPMVAEEDEDEEGDEDLIEAAEADEPDEPGNTTQAKELDTYDSAIDLAKSKKKQRDAIVSEKQEPLTVKRSVGRPKGSGKSAKQTTHLDAVVEEDIPPAQSAKVPLTKKRK